VAAVSSSQTKVLPARAALLKAVGYDLGRIRSTRGTMYNAAIAETLGLSISDLRCYEIIDRSPNPITGKHLSDATGLTTAAITGVVDRLEAQKLIKRTPHPTDRRQIILEPLPEAKKKVVALYEPLRQGMMTLTNSYNDEQLAIIADYLERATAVIVEATERLKEL
jgi:DNA-binding MarR family transcriptional regulator